MSSAPRLRASFTGALLLATILAGCFSSDGPGDDPAISDGRAQDAPDLGVFMNPLVQGHDHESADGHNLEWNMVRTGGRLLETGLRGYGQPHALDIKADRLFVSAYAATGDPVAGVYIFDLSVAPDNPPLVGQWNIVGPGAGDRNMEATADGNFVVISFEAFDCGGNVHPAQPGIYLLNTSDPANPVEVDYQTVQADSLGQHSITIFSTNDDDWVYHGGGDDIIYRIDRVNQKLEPAGTFRGGHDSSIFIDRINNIPVLLSAEVSTLGIYDLSNPRDPTLIGGWSIPGRTSYYIHTAVAQEIAGRNILVVNSEDFRHDPTAFWILDITQPNAPFVLANWTAPDDVPSGDLLFSLHNPRLDRGILTFSFYHGGVWQFDLNDPARWENPEPRAYYLPTAPVGATPGQDAAPVISPVCGRLLGGTDDRLDVLTTGIPFTFDVEMQNGLVYAADLQTGVHVLKFAPGAGTVGHDQ